MVRELKLTCPKCENHVTIRADDKGVFPATVKCSGCGAIFEKAHQIPYHVESMAIPTKKCWMCGELVYIADFILAVAMKQNKEIDEIPEKPTCRKCLIAISQHPSSSVKVY